MKIESVSISNYKCHKELSNVNFHDITTFIGENDSGKTSIIDFLELMLSNKIPQKVDFFHDSDDEYEHEIIGEITFNPNFELQEPIQHLLNKNNRLKIKKILTSTNVESFVEIKKYDDDKLNNFESMDAKSLPSLLAEYGIEAQSNQEKRKEKIRGFLSASDVPFNYGFVLIDWKDLALFLPKIIRYDVNDYKNPANIIFKTFREKFDNLLYEYDEINGSRNLKNEELIRILDEAEGEINSEAQKLNDYIKKYNPDIDDIYISPEFDFSNSLISTNIEIIDKTTQSSIPFENRGFGTQKRLFMGIFDWESSVIKKLGSSPVIRCYDEPDTNLHIDAQRKMYKAIKKIVESDTNNQIVVCTHSLFMIDNMPIKTIKLLKRNGDSTTSIESLEGKDDVDTTQFMTSVCKEMGLSNSHIFFEKAFILVEGPTEVNFLPLAYNKIYGSLFTEDGISLINLEGNGAATNFLKLLMKNKRDLICLFLDSDTKTFREKELYKAYNTTTADCSEDEYKGWVDEFFSQKVMLIGEKEFEDSFSDDFIVRVLNKHRPKATSSWVAEDITKLRSTGKFSDAILREVASNCNNYISKPQLGKHFAEECTVTDIPDKVKELFEVVREIVDL
ncbi:MAG: AAA family ATPase [Methanolobus sp.]|nr:AAA family ATPase [Methanolobus sp.]